MASNRRSCSVSRSNAVGPGNAAEATTVTVLRSPAPRRARCWLVSSCMRRQPGTSELDGQVREFQGWCAPGPSPRPPGSTALGLRMPARLRTCSGSSALLRVTFTPITEHDSLACARSRTPARPTPGSAEPTECEAPCARDAALGTVRHRELQVPASRQACTVVSGERRRRRCPLRGSTLDQRVGGNISSARTWLVEQEHPPLTQVAVCPGRAADRL